MNMRVVGLLMCIVSLAGLACLDVSRSSTFLLGAAAGANSITLIRVLAELAVVRRLQKADAIERTENVKRAIDLAKRIHRSKPSQN